MQRQENKPVPGTHNDVFRGGPALALSKSRMMVRSQSDMSKSELTTIIADGWQRRHGNSRNNYEDGQGATSRIPEGWRAMIDGVIAGTAATAANTIGLDGGDSGKPHIDANTVGMGDGDRGKL